MVRVALTTDDAESPKQGGGKESTQRLNIPPELPGAEANLIELPALEKENSAARQEAIERLFPPLPSVDSEFRSPTSQGKPLLLNDLEEMARQNSPSIQQAVADVRAAQNAALQAGLYPNPTAGYEADTINTGSTAGYQGGFIEQVIKTGSKLELSRASEMVNVDNARVNLRKAKVDLASNVRSTYFAALAAQKNVRISHGLVTFSDEVYTVQVDMVKGGQAAPYEPLQLRALAYQARANLLQARNHYASAWKQLAAAVGLPGLPPTELAEKLDAPVPVVPYDVALTTVLTNHPDVETALNTLRQARINLRLAQANRIPDVTLHTALQKDYTTPPFGATVNIVVGAPLPLWDRNQGNIGASEAALAKALEGPHLTRLNLTARLAEVYERYQNNLTLVDYYRTSILPDQVQSYRGTSNRHQKEPDVVGFSDVVSAQQNLSSAIAAYVTALGALWQAAVDLGNLMQADDLFLIGNAQPVARIPDFEQICPLPCRSNAGAADPAQLMDRTWLPQEVPAKHPDEIPVSNPILPR